jgi:hypothetical protein
MSIEGKIATVNRKKFRREVSAGRASWLDRMPADLRPHPGIARHAGPPVAPVRVALAKSPAKKVRRFGEGLGERHPVYRAPVNLSDMAWWEEEAQREQDREIDRMYEAYRTQERLEAGLDC